MFFREITGQQAVDKLNKILEYLETVCDACDDNPQDYNKHIDIILRENGVFSGKVYKLKGEI